MPFAFGGCTTASAGRNTRIWKASPADNSHYAQQGKPAKYGLQRRLQQWLFDQGGHIDCSDGFSDGEEIGTPNPMAIYGRKIRPDHGIGAIRQGPHGNSHPGAILGIGRASTIVHALSGGIQNLDLAKTGFNGLSTES